MTLLPFLACMCVYIYMCLCVVWVYLNMCTCGSRDQSGMSFFRMASSLLNSLRQTFSLAWGLLIWLDWSASEPQECLSLSPQCWDHEYLPLYPAFSCGFWGIELRTLCFQDKHYWLRYLLSLLMHSTKLPQLPSNNSNTYQERKLLELLSTLTTPQV